MNEITTQQRIDSFAYLAEISLENTKRDLTSACYNGVLTGLLLLKIKSLVTNVTSGETSTAKSVTNVTDLATRGRNSKGEGFAAICEKIGIQRQTAYRWMNAAANALCTLQNSDKPDLTLIPSNPSEGPEWEDFCRTIHEHTAKTTLSRLSLGACAEGDLNRLETIQSKAENGDQLAAEYLEKIETGQMTLIQAIRALAGADATKDQPRAEIIYCDIDPKSGKLTGLAPRALTSLNNAIKDYPNWSKSAQKAFRDEWRTFIHQLPQGI